MELAQVYDGCVFPDYDYTCNSIITIAMTPRSEPENTKKISWLRLPMPDISIERSMLRAGIETLEDTRIAFSENNLPHELGHNNRKTNTAELERPVSDCGAIDGPERDKLNAASSSDNASKVCADFCSPLPR